MAQGLTGVTAILNGNPPAAWLAATGVAAAAFLAMGLARRIGVARLAAIAARTRTDADDVAVGVLRRTRPFFLLALALYAGIQLLVLPPRAQQLLSGALTLAVVAQLGLWGNALAGLLAERHARRQAPGESTGTTSVQLLGLLARFALWTVLVLLALDNLGIKITAIIAGLGVGGVAVALAVQNILGDLFASLSIVLDRPFVLGDFVVVDELMGSVEHIGLKTTRIRSLAGEQIVFSNADLLKSRIRNYKRMLERRVVLQLGVVYDTPPEMVARLPAIIRDIIDAQDGIRFDRAHFKGFGASSLDFEAVYFVLDPDYNRYMDLQQAINLSVLRRFATEGVEFAFPTRTLFVRPDAAMAPSERPAAEAVTVSLGPAGASRRAGNDD